MDWGNAILMGLVATTAMTALTDVGKAIGIPMDVLLQHVAFRAVGGSVYGS